MRAVIDTNVWVSGLLTPLSFSARVPRALADGLFSPVFCGRLLLELKDTITDRGFVRRNGLDLPALNRLIGLLTQRGEEFLDPVTFPTLCRDPDDDIFIALAVAAKVDYLVTRDDDLTGDEAVREHLSAAGVQIVTIREFVAILEQDPVR